MANTIRQNERRLRDVRCNISFLKRKITEARDQIYLITQEQEGIKKILAEEEKSTKSESNFLIDPLGINATSQTAATKSMDFYLEATEIPNQRYKIFSEKHTITIPKAPVLSSEKTIFTMGSCFAEEVRRALTKFGFKCTPNYRDICFDPSEAIIDTLPDREHMNFYNSFSIRQQIETILGIIEQDENDYWEVGRLSRKVVSWEEYPNYQDPYLRLVVAKTPDKLKEIVKAVHEKIRSGFHKSDAFVFTFGMTEVFVNRASGKVVCQKPAYAGGGGEKETFRHDSTFEENVNNLRQIIRLIRKEKPNAPIFMTVSPVALERTFRKKDVVTASFEGKAILRSAIGQVMGEFDYIYYFPSYEYIALHGVNAFRDDLRHVKTSLVEKIIFAFKEAYYD